MNANRFLADRLVECGCLGSCQFVLCEAVEGTEDTYDERSQFVAEDSF